MIYIEILRHVPRMSTVYFQRNTVLVVLFVFKVMNFHISMIVGFFGDYNFLRFSFFYILSHGTTKPTKS